MKHRLLFTIVLLPLQLFAQFNIAPELGISTSSNDVFYRGSFSRHGVDGGLISWRAGICLSQTLSKHFQVQVVPSYVRKGFAYSTAFAPDLKAGYGENYNYIEMPVHLSYRILSKKRMGMFGGISLYGALCTGGKVRAPITFPGEGTATERLVPGRNMAQWDAGIGLHIGGNLSNRTCLRISYTHGLMDVKTYSNGYTMNQSCSVTAGYYIFKPKPVLRDPTFSKN